MSDEMQQPGDTAGAAATERARLAAKDCVHCGFCLPACPTYQLWGEEMDSPRGRIHLVSQLLDGAPLTPAAADHFDRCLGCMACMTACPSGVQYDQIIEAAREWTEDAREGAGGPVRAAAAEPAGVATGITTAGTTASGTVTAGGPPGGVASGVRRPLRDKVTREVIFALFPYPARLRVATAPLRVLQWTGADRLLALSGLVGRVSPAAEAALRLAPSSRPLPPGRFPERVPARGPRRAVVGMLTGCVQSVFFPRVNAATARVLAAEGCDVVIPRNQGCCGALSLHSGRVTEGIRLAQQVIATFEAAGVDIIIVNSAGCGSSMKEYERLFAHLAGEDDAEGAGGDGTQGGATPGQGHSEHGGRDEAVSRDGVVSRGEAASWAARAAALTAKVRDLAEFLDELGPVAERHPVPVRAVYHDACHLGHAQRVTAAPRTLLRGVPSLELVELRDAGTCCGSAGVYNLLQPDTARELGDRKADSVLASEASLLISANPGCTLQISSALAARGMKLRTAHTAEVLDASINGVPLG